MSRQLLLQKALFAGSLENMWKGEGPGTGQGDWEKGGEKGAAGGRGGGRKVEQENNVDQEYKRCGTWGGGGELGCG